MKVVTYYKKYTGGSNSIVDALKAGGISSSMENRRKIAELNGIKNYKGTGAQNKKMLNLLKQGKLIKKITIKVVKTNRDKFVEHLYNTNKLYAKYGKKIVYGYSNIPKTYESAQKKLKNGKTISSTCLIPTHWALKSLKINPGNFYAKEGKFVNVSSSMKKHLTKISGKKYTVKEAVDKKYLKPGDICCFKGLSHTFTYTGKGYQFFDGGHASIKNGRYVGIVCNYATNYYKKKELAYILRWR